jgi:multiple sugar transport system substrate-binding protein
MLRGGAAVTSSRGRRRHRHRPGHAEHLRVHLQDETATTRVDTFRKADPQVQVKVTEGGFDEQQVLSAVAGAPPDLVDVDRGIIGTYAARGAVQPLDDCVASAQIDNSDRSQLAGMAERVTVSEGGKPRRIGFDPGIPEFLPMWVRANGGPRLSDDGRTAQLNDPRWSRR